MPHIASMLKQEIARVARREVRRETAAFKKALAAHRSDIAALRRRAVELERQLRAAARSTAAAAPAANDESIPEGIRFSAKGLAGHRKRLGLSAGDLGPAAGRVVADDLQLGERQGAAASQVHADAGRAAVGRQAGDAGAPRGGQGRLSRCVCAQDQAAADLRLYIAMQSYVNRPAMRLVLLSSSSRWPMSDGPSPQPRVHS